MPLTVNAIKAIKSTSKRQRVSDGGGLLLETSPKGIKTWKMIYRFAGKQKELALGRWPDYHLAAARNWREDIKAQLRDGIDPATQKAVERRAKLIEEADETFESVAKEWLGKQHGNFDERYHKWVTRRFEHDVYAEIGSVPINDVGHAEILRLIRRFEQRGAIEIGRKTLRYVAKVMRYAVVTQRADSNPVPDAQEAMTPRPKVKHFSKLPAKRLPEFFAKLREAKCDDVTKLALRWTILTMVRTQETRFFRPEEIEGRRTGELTWRLTPERMKMSREHIVPLPRQAGPLLEEIERIARASGSAWQFPQAINPEKPISENCMLYCLYDLGYKGVATVHGFRGLASTVLNEALTIEGERRFDKDWIEMQLAHSEEDEVRGAYNAAEYLGARRRMMQWWADYLDEQEGFSDLI